MSTLDAEKCWATLEQSLAHRPLEWEPEKEWRAGFDLARRVQGVLMDCGHKPRRSPTPEIKNWVSRFAQEHDLDGDEVLEQFQAAWPKIRRPDRMTPFQAATERAEEDGPLPGEWPTERLRQSAGRILAIACVLAQDGVCFLPVRMLAKVLGCDMMYVSRALQALVENGFLRKADRPTPRHAQRYAVLKTGARDLSDVTESP